MHSVSYSCKMTNPATPKLRKSKIAVLLGSLVTSALVLAGCGSASVAEDPAASTEPATASSTQTSAASSSSSDEKVVYLTYDDGPAADTRSLLKVLKKHGAQATFFVVGELSSRNHAMINEIHDQGHFIGNHTWAHPMLTELPASKVRWQLESTQQATPHIGNCYRPPYGAADAKVDKVASALGLEKVMWNIVTGDWDPLTVAKIRSRILSAKPGDIILMHDGPANRENTVTATDQALSILKERGFVAKGVPACSP